MAEIKYVLSADEIQATVKRATKASGITWGLAEEFGYCAKWLSIRKINACALIRNIMEKHHNTQNFIKNAAYLNDQKNNINKKNPIHIENITAPIILAPFIAGADKTISIIRQKTKITVMQEELYVKGPLYQKITSTISVIREENKYISPDQKHYPIGAQGCAVKKTDWLYLSKKARQTFVPESTISRQHGAG